MKKTYLYYLAFFLIALLSVRCGKDAVSDTGSSTPTGADPYLIDAVLCLDLKNGKPDKITSVFIKDDPVIIWMEWDNVIGEHDVDIEWYDPDGDLEIDDYKSFDSRNGRQIVWFQLTPSTPVELGVWTVVIYLDGAFQRSYLFDII